MATLAQGVVGPPPPGQVVVETVETCASGRLLQTGRHIKTMTMGLNAIVNYLPMKLPFYECPHVQSRLNIISSKSDDIINSPFSNILFKSLIYPFNLVCPVG